MVSKITIFEPHFDGAQFGPASLESDEPAVETDVTEDETATEVETRGRSLGRSLMGIVGIGAGLMIGIRIIRRTRSKKSESVEIEETAENAPVIET